MVSVLVFLVALVPVLVTGALLIELLMAGARRRGKRPDIAYTSGSAEPDLAAALAEAARTAGARDALIVGRVICGNGGAEAAATKNPARRRNPQ